MGIKLRHWQHRINTFSFLTFIQVNQRRGYLLKFWKNNSLKNVSRFSGKKNIKCSFLNLSHLTIQHQNVKTDLCDNLFFHYRTGVRGRTWWRQIMTCQLDKLIEAIKSVYKKYEVILGCFTWYCEFWIPRFWISRLKWRVCKK